MRGGRSGGSRSVLKSEGEVLREVCREGGLLGGWGGGGEEGVVGDCVGDGAGEGGFLKSGRGEDLGGVVVETKGEGVEPLAGGNQPIYLDVPFLNLEDLEASFR